MVSHLWQLLQLYNSHLMFADDISFSNKGTHGISFYLIPGFSVRLLFLHCIPISLIFLSHFLWLPISLYMYTYLHFTFSFCHVVSLFLLLLIWFSLSLSLSLYMYIPAFLLENIFPALIPFSQHSFIFHFRVIWTLSAGMWNGLIIYSLFYPILVPNGVGNSQKN